MAKVSLSNPNFAKIVSDIAEKSFHNTSTQKKYKSPLKDAEGQPITISPTITNEYDRVTSVIESGGDAEEGEEAESALIRRLPPIAEKTKKEVPKPKQPVVKEVPKKKVVEKPKVVEIPKEAPKKKPVMKEFVAQSKPKKQVVEKPKAVESKTELKWDASLVGRKVKRRKSEGVVKKYEKYGRYKWFVKWEKNSKIESEWMDRVELIEYLV